MKGRNLSRRALVLGGLLAAAGPARAQSAAPDPATLRFRAIVVDTSRLARLGSPGTAEIVRRQLEVDARDIFADRMAPADRRAPELLIRIDSLSLASYAGGGFVMQEGSSNTDYLEGAGMVTAGGQVLSTTPILSALDASYSGAWYTADIDARRVASITHHFAYWLRRQMGI